MNAPASPGPIVDIVKKFDRAVDLVVSGHTHRAYVCDIDGRLVTSGDKYGTLVTAIDLKLDPVNARHRQRQGRQRHRRQCIACEGSRTDRADRSPTTSSPAPIANRPAGSVTQTLSRVPNEAGESALGDVIADAQLAATSAEEWRRRDRLHQSRRHPHRHRPKKDDGAVTLCRPVRQPAVPQSARHADADGRQIKDMLEQQWLDPKRPRILQVSNGFSYAWDARSRSASA